MAVGKMRWLGRAGQSDTPSYTVAQPPSLTSQPRGMIAAAMAPDTNEKGRRKREYNLSCAGGAYYAEFPGIFGLTAREARGCQKHEKRTDGTVLSSLHLDSCRRVLQAGPANLLGGNSKDYRPKCQI